MKRTSYLIIAVIAIFLIIIAYWRYGILTKEKSLDINNEHVYLKVQVNPVIKGKLTDWVFTEGTVNAYRRVYLQPDTQGLVRSIKNKHDIQWAEGMFVSGPKNNDQLGEVLLQFDNQSLQAQKRSVLAEIKVKDAEIQQAKNNLNRLDKLHKRQVITESELESSQTLLNMALAGQEALHANLSRIDTLLDKTTIRAPFDAVIKRINVREGDYYSSSGSWGYDEKRERDSLMVLIDNQHQEVVVQLPQWSGQNLRVGQPAYVALNSHELSVSEKSQFKEGQVVTGTVYAVSPSLSLDKRMIEVKIKLNNQQQAWLQDGSYVSVWIEKAQRDNVTLVPRHTVMMFENKHFVYLYDANTQTAKEAEVKIGTKGLDAIEILAGVKEGDKIIVSNIHRLTEGRKVKVLEITQ